MHAAWVIASWKKTGLNSSNTWCKTRLNSSGQILHLQEIHAGDLLGCVVATARVCLDPYARLLQGVCGQYVSSKNLVFGTSQLCTAATLGADGIVL